MLVNIGIPPTSILKLCLPSNQPAPGYVPIEFDMAPIVRSLGLGTSARKASNTGLFCAQCSAGDEPGVNKNVELDDFPMKTSPFVVGFPSHSAEKIRKDLDGDWGGFGPRVSELDLNRAMENVPCIDDSWWFMMIYDDFWWFMMIYDDLWWFMMIYDDLWWFMMISDDFWWFMMIYDDVWWSLRTQRVIVTWTLNGCWINFWHVYSVNLRFSLKMCVFFCRDFHGFSEIIFWDHAKWCPVSGLWMSSWWIYDDICVVFRWLTHSHLYIQWMF